MFDYRSEESFGNFVDIINGSIEGNCKVNDKLISKSKRNKLYKLNYMLHKEKHSLL